ncbi:Asp-tRNA(Asn)/Glu-tRNA(Gln) amidotransferase subunit GatB [Piscinibacterium candidicorallinum]|jgi:aspartyl-tRNA(Asn)/glutamyl-tRNA(Gln) amidotransferase subunit B|uniref:Aspartyl/glutamyl-tRNA(Asn/Gln) amidotransferase subunit B n=1 Tax=Piscinibacterium candidicorallinum TaxID=1793872 RepID=A0ABV7HBH5_9BURK
MTWEVVIGIETHVQLSTTSKIFSGSSTQFGAAPNTQANAVDMALPGVLPVMNRGAVQRAIQFGLAVGGQVAAVSQFERKNYFYPDLPKAYQISQYEVPVVSGGGIIILLEDGSEKTIRLTRAHLEEDAGKSVHEGMGAFSGIDLNRAGTPLLEIVSEPDIANAKEAVAYAKALHGLVVWLGICDGNMQEGSFRCDANVSVRRPGTPLGTRREIKNLNSFRFLEEAINYEVREQIRIIEDGGKIQQATVLFDPDRGETRVMRTKEDAHDYRYFPDPDLPPLTIDADWIERTRAAMPELPAQLKARYQTEYGLPAYDAALMTQSRGAARYFEVVRERSGQPKLAANWIMGEVSRRLNAEDRSFDDAQLPVDPSVLGSLIRRITDGTLSNSGAKQVFEDLWVSGPRTEGDAQTLVDEAIDRLGLRQMSDTGAIEAILDEVLAANQKSVDEFRAGKDKAFNALVGQAMKATKGKANPALVNELLKKKLG